VRFGNVHLRDSFSLSVAAPCPPPPPLSLPVLTLPVISLPVIQALDPASVALLVGALLRDAGIDVVIPPPGADGPVALAQGAYVQVNRHPLSIVHSGPGPAPCVDTTTSTYQYHARSPSSNLSLQ
jgi:hypothetical protein